MKGRNLHPGDWAVTDYWKGWTLVEITGRQNGAGSESGVRLECTANGQTVWLDSNWFKRAPKAMVKEYGA